jgi:hypothetical protein
VTLGAHAGMRSVNEGIWAEPTSFILPATHSAAEVDRALGRSQRSLQAVRVEGATKSRPMLRRTWAQRRTTPLHTRLNGSPV